MMSQQSQQPLKNSMSSSSSPATIPSVHSQQASSDLLRKLQETTVSRTCSVLRLTGSYIDFTDCRSQNLKQQDGFQLRWQLQGHLSRYQGQRPRAESRVRRTFPPDRDQRPEQGLFEEWQWQEEGGQELTVSFLGPCSGPGVDDLNHS